MLNVHRILWLTLAIVFLAALLSGGAQETGTPPPSPTVASPFPSFRDIPGVTEKEIRAIEALQKGRPSFVYGMPLSTESFLHGNGDAGGYAALLCQWLTGLFGMPFKLELFLWTELHEKLKNGVIDFSGHMMPDEKSLKEFYMTDYIAARQFIIIRLAGSHDMHEILKERPLRYAFTANSPTEPAVAAVTKLGTYKPIWLKDYAEAYALLVNGEADAFITTSAAEAHFIDYDNLVIEDFFPLIFNPVSLATAKPELAPVISLVNKALKNGAVPYLNDLYNQGYYAYKKHKFHMSLNAQEKAYLQNTKSVPIAALYFNYPIVFYNTHEKKWDGITFSLLNEISMLSGLSFNVVNDEGAEIYDLMQMLQEGRVHMLSYLICSAKREPHYIWGKHKLMTDQYALLSKIEFPNVNINEIPFARIALIKNTAYAEMFRTWFPNAINTAEYENPNEAFFALEQGKVDMVMSAKSNLLYFAHYYEFSGYKANYLFNQRYESAFAFNREQAVLRSIVDKATAIIGTDVIVEQWLTKTYDYKTRVMAAQRPWLIGAVSMSLIVLALLLMILHRKRNEGKRLEELVALRTHEISEAEAHTEKLLQEMETLILITEIETDTILFANEKIKRDFHFADNVIGKKCWNVLYEHEFTTRRCDFCPKDDPALDAGDTVTWERFIPATNRHYRILSRYIDWPSGSKVFLQQYDDITEIKESIAKIRETDEYTQLLLDATPLSCTLWNRDLKMMNCNLESLKLFEVKDKQDFFEHYMENAPEFQPNGENSVEAGFAMLKKAFESEYSRFEWVHMLPSGEPLPSEITLVRVKYKDDFLVAGYIRDLREHKKYIDEINVSIQNIQEANEYTQILLDATPLSCSLWAGDLTIINCNKETLTLFAIEEKDQFIENFYDFSPEFQPCGRNSREWSMERLRIAFEEGYYRTEWVHQTSQRDPLPCEVILVRVKYKNEYLVAAYVRDLREQKVNLAEIHKARDAAEAANRTKSIFLANMSHEIRTPMNSIIGFSELAQYDEIPSKTREYLSNISESAKWLLNIINDILDISKIESGKIELERIPFDLHDIVAHCLSAIAPKAEEKGITLDCYAEPTLSRKLLGDPVRLRQALMNLLSNAVKFTSAGKIKFSVSVVHADDDRITMHFEVKDTGMGMSPDQIKRIFEPFMQADDSVTRRFGGTGLGLPITKNILELMGGTLKVESDTGVGSTFNFALTFDIVEAADMPSQDIMAASLVKPHFTGEVLICEDNSMNQQVICDNLARVGLQSVVANNGKEGLDILAKRINNAEKPFDLIFMDIHMSVMDGLEAASKIAEMAIKTPIVATTANIMSNDLELYKASGMSDCLGKPFTSKELWKCLLKYIPVVGFGPAYKHQSVEEEALQKMLKANFVTSNQTTYDAIQDAAGAGDVKLAHRLAHTLKGNAGQIGAKRLQEAAAAVEAMFAGGEDLPDEDTMGALKAELTSVLHQLEPFLMGAGSNNIGAITDVKRVREMFEKLEPLLRSNNSECLHLLDDLRAIPGTEELARQIDNFKFKQAVEALTSLKKAWE